MKRLMLAGGLLLAVTPYLVLGGKPLKNHPTGERLAAGGNSSRWSGVKFETALTGADEVPLVVTESRGAFKIKFNEDFTAARFKLRVLDGTAITQAHLHCASEGANGPVVVFLSGNVPGGFDVHGVMADFTMTNANIAAVPANCAASIGRTIANLADLADAASDGLIYANVHSVAHPGGEIRGQLADHVHDRHDEANDDNEDDDDDDDKDD
jgi:hypothetical protein